MLPFTIGTHNLPLPTALPVASDGIEVTVVATEGNVETDNGLAGLNVLEVLGVNAGLGSGGVEEKLNLFEETGLVVLIKTGAGSSGNLGSESAL